MAVRLEEMDQYVAYARQLEETTGPVVLVNHFSIDPRDAAAFQGFWREAAAYMKQQPGFISAQLHRGIGGSGAFLNVAVWESAAALAAATRAPDFHRFGAQLSGDVVARPHVFEKVAVPGICLA